MSTFKKWFIRVSLVLLVLLYLYAMFNRGLHFRMLIY